MEEEKKNELEEVKEKKFNILDFFTPRNITYIVAGALILIGIIVIIVILAINT